MSSIVNQQDIKQHPQVRSINQASEARLRAIFDTAIEGIITIDNTGIIQLFNPAAEKIFAYRANEVVGKNISILMPTPYQEEHDSYIQNYIANGITKIIGIGRELEGKRKDGIVFPMWLSVAEFFENEQRFFTGFIRDLTVEKNYQKKAGSYEHILENSFNEIYIFDADSLHFVRANKGALENLQYSSDEIIKLTPVDIKPEYSLEKFQELIRPLRSGEQNKIVFITKHQRKDGSLYPVEEHLEFFEFESKKVFISIILDITERIQAEEKVRIQQEQLAHMDRLSIMGEMVAGVAHEINQPLTAINSYAQAAKRRIQGLSFDIEKLQDFLEKISKASVRAGDVIKQLHKMAKQQPQNRNSVDINPLIFDTVKIAELDIQAHEFKINLNLDTDLPHVVIDSVQIQQVILNLIRNAMDAAAREIKENKLIYISSTLLTEENRIHMSVKDYGCGIDKETAEQLFNPFYTTKKSGIGLGLSICHAIIQDHGGRLWFTHNTDKGTTFHFTLPTVLDDE